MNYAILYVKYVLTHVETVAEQELKDGSETTETFSFEIVEKYDSYTRAGNVTTVDGVRYVVDTLSRTVGILISWNCGK